MGFGILSPELSNAYTNQVKETKICSNGSQCDQTCQPMSDSKHCRSFFPLSSSFFMFSELKHCFVACREQYEDVQNADDEAWAEKNSFRVKRVSGQISTQRCPRSEHGDQSHLRKQSWLNITKSWSRHVVPHGWSSHKNDPNLNLIRVISIISKTEILEEMIARKLNIEKNWKTNLTLWYP